MHVDELKAMFPTMEAAAKFLGIKSQNFTHWRKKYGGEIPAKHVEKLNAAASVDSPPITGERTSTDVAAPDQV